MKQHSHLIILVGGLLAFFCFALPWSNDDSGALLANSGEGTLVTILLIFSLTLFCISINMLNRYTTWKPFSKIIALFVTHLSLFFFFIIVNIIIGNIISSGRSEILTLSQILFSTFIGNIFLFIITLVIIGICVYVANPYVYQEFWRGTLSLILGGVSIWLCIVVSLSIKNIGINIFVLSLITALTITGFSIYRLIRQSTWQSWSTFIILISSGVGLCIFLILFFGQSLNLMIGSHSLYNPQYGAFLTAIGYLLAIIGVLSCIETKESQETQAILEEETTTK